MLHLYYKPSCPYCQRVLAAAEQIGVSFVLHDVGTDIERRTELIAKGGKRQVPFLVDDERGVMMYESGDIIDYLDKQYGTGNVSVPPAPNVCPIE